MSIELLMNFHEMMKIKIKLTQNDWKMEHHIDRESVL